MPHPAADPLSTARAAMAGEDWHGALAALESLPAPARDAAAWCLAGAACLGLGDAAAALAAFDAACRLDPWHAGAGNGAAAALAALGRHDEAADRLARLLAEVPDDADALCNLALIELRRGNPEVALAAARRATATGGDRPDAWSACGEALLALGRAVEAAEAWAQADVLQPGSPDHAFNRGEALLAADSYAAAREAYEAALAANPAFGAAAVGRAIVLAMEDRPEEADREFHRLARADPAALRTYFANMARSAGSAVPDEWRPVAEELRAARLAHRLEAGDWTADQPARAAFSRLAAQARSGRPLHERALVFHALHTGLPEADLADIASGVAQAIRRAHPPRGRARPRAARDRIRLGIVTPSVGDHPSTQIQWRRLALHDRSRFEVFAYALTPPDGSDLARRFQAACDTFRPMAGANSDAIAWRIARDGIDILMDVSGHFEHSRPEVLVLRPAVLNISYLGMPASLGAGIADYRITDPICTPHALEPAWPEALIRLPGTHFIYNDEETVADEPPARAAWGLPEGSLVFCCFNSAAKYDPDSFAAWMTILGQVPEAVLWLLDPGSAARGRLASAAIGAGIRPDRLVFAARIPRPRHLARLRCADLFLDTFRYGAHTTAADALWAGLPVLTRAGGTMAARLGSSIVAAAGTPEMAVADTAAYVAAALRLAARPEELLALRSRLAARAGALFATATRVRELDRALVGAWERHLRGLPPASFDLEPE